MNMEELKINDIVQVINKKNLWFSCLIIIYKIKSWGIEGYLNIPYYKKDNNKLYIKLSFEEIKKVGESIIFE